MSTAPEPTLSVGEAAAFLSRAVVVDDQAPAVSLDDVLADLSSLGLPPGGVVVLALSNGRQVITCYFAALLLGLVPLAVSPATPTARLVELARRLGAHALIAARIDAARFGSAALRTIGATHGVVLSPAPDRAYASGEVLMLTSGTSGIFTACVHHRSSLLRNAQRHADAIGLRPDDVMLVNLPMYYSYAMVAQVLAAYVRGARLVISGPPFTPPAYRSALLRHDVTVSSITPLIARMLLNHRERLPPSLRVCTVGGDRIDARQVAQLLALHPGGELYLTYGLTEAGPRVSTLAAHGEPAARHSSVGLPLPGVRTWLRNSGEEGELLVESDTVLLRRAGVDAGSEGRGIIAPQVIATGDVFHIDQDGYLFFRGRLSDFLVVRGEKVSLYAVRHTALRLPGVLSCTPSVQLGADDEVCIDLDVVVTDAQAGDERLIRRALNAYLLPSERPRRITVRTADTAAFRK